ncbi:hypothetical protein OBP_032 [Pseudomonas phage OBP]|uniref:hypothetical protein n=1 Tax=Pseudomonas phage OBP TaxID=1124849 RepID=UPI000240D61D|nr:hypothetical protein OBP_032 [Pseudomonas phage OBP]AEV89469.1 hypothetical protein OBP_032 [Pseudomonas phage OBP]
MKLPLFVKSVSLSFCTPELTNSFKAQARDWVSSNKLGYSNALSLALNYLDKWDGLEPVMPALDDGSYVRIQFITGPDGRGFKMDTFGIRFVVFPGSPSDEFSHYPSLPGKLVDLLVTMLTPDIKFSVFDKELTVSNNVSTSPYDLYNPIKISQSELPHIGSLPTTHTLKFIKNREGIEIGISSGSLKYMMVPLELFENMTSKLAEDNSYNPDVNVGLTLIKDFKEAIDE